MKKSGKAIFKTILLWMMSLTAGLILICGLLLAIWMQDDSWPELDFNRLENMKQTIFIYDDQDQQVANLANRENRVLVGLDRISPYLQQAFILTEDARFYAHPGVDIYRIFGAVWANFRSGSLDQGASTLTQQLIKLTHLSPEKTFVRKIQEAVLALQAEQHYTKDEILTLYLNIVYFGNGAYGVEAASQSYFGKSALDLTCSEAALLAGIVKAPGTYAPHINLEKSIERRDLILGIMYENGAIDETLYQASLAETPMLKLSRPGNYDYGYYVDAALDETTEKLDISYEELISSGYHIYTALEPWLQTACENVFSDAAYFPADAADGTQVQGALGFLDSDTGMVKALMGGREYTTQRGFDRFRNALRQPGSTVKPLLAFAPAIELNGLSPATPILDAPMSFNGYTPGNAGGGYHGWITLRYALSHSVNIPAVQLLDDVGIPLAKSYAENAGLTFASADNGLSLALGGFTHGVTPLSLAGSYTVFAGDGIAHTPSMIRCITDNSGNILYRHESDGRRVFSRETVFLINDMLLDAVEEGSAQALQQAGIPLCCKTGTVAYEGASISGVRDVWAAAYNTDYIGVCWMGFDNTNDDHCLPSSASGGKYAVPVLAKIFSDLYPQGNAPEFSAPLNVVKVTVDRTAAKQGKLMLASEYTPGVSRMTDYFTRGTEPTVTTTFWGLPDAPDILDHGISEKRLPYIRFQQKSTAYRTLIFRSDDGGASFQEIVRFEPGHQLLLWEDASAQIGKRYIYYLQSQLPDEGNTAIDGSKTDTLSMVVPFWDDFFYQFFGR